MGLRNTTPLTLAPRGISDALDSTTVFSGAMQTLQNLIPDPSTRNIWQCRPASTEIIDMTATLGVVSALKVIGDYAFGMAASVANPGFDEPYALNLLSGTLTTITGVTTANIPATQPASGAWTPPTMALVGTKILFTHPGFNGSVNGFFGVLDISTLSAPVWSSGNLTGAIIFTIPPTAVANFNGRAWWIENGTQPATIFSDQLAPTVVTQASQVITYDDNTPLTAFGQLSAQNIAAGGITQALMVFKGVSAMYQITGDAADQLASTLTRNTMGVPTGTLGPNSIVSTPKGMMFIAPDGLRVLDFNSIISEPIGVDGMGKTLPFVYSNVPSRVAAAANGSVVRISVQDNTLLGSPWVEYWYDIPRQSWSGPHTFPAAMIEAWKDTFVMAPVGVPGKLFRSDYVQSSTATFTENGTALQFQWTTCMLPDTDQMAENAMVETTLHAALNSGDTYAVIAQDQDGKVVQSATVNVAGTTTLWNQFLWNQSVWNGAIYNVYPRPLPWPGPVVFRRLQIVASGPASDVLRIGRMHMRYEQLGYLQMPSAA
jgi:hypothetical protein